MISNLRLRGKVPKENLREVPRELRGLPRAAEEAKRGQSGMIQISFLAIMMKVSLTKQWNSNLRALKLQINNLK